MSSFIGRYINDDTLTAVARLRDVADQAGLTMAELALAWVLRQDNVASAIVGASRPEQVHANARAAGRRLTDDTLAAIDAALGDVVQREPQPAPGGSGGVLHRA
jgi:aryl-alcohol dehydrogenase-like predicted oxidoreductase